MNDVVPSALLRLRAADIIHSAGLTAASLGQEYCRAGTVQSPRRDNARLSGMIDLSQVGSGANSRSNVAPEALTSIEASAAQSDGSSGSLAVNVAEQAAGSPERHRYAVEIEIQGPGKLSAACACGVAEPSLCSHAAALLYYWLAHPSAFFTSAFEAAGAGKNASAHSQQPQSLLNSLKTPGLSKQPGYSIASRGPSPLGNIADIVALLGLSELRAMAREYELATTGLNKQQLAATLLNTIKQPEAVRRVAATLEKPQRQLLATLILAGGAMTDDDVRSLFERFAFGTPDKLHTILASLQGKGLLFRASLNSLPQQRFGVSGSPFDTGWFVPQDVRSALRATVPVTPFDVQKVLEGEDKAPTVLQVKPSTLSADLLFVARALDGYRFEHDEEQHASANTARGSFFQHPLPPSVLPPGDESVAAAPPAYLPSASMVACLQSLVSRTPAFLRFAVRLLRLADILHKDDAATPVLRALPTAAHLLLGPASPEVARELFELWLTQQSYDELFELQQEGLRLRCRTTAFNHSLVRPGELELENCEARQTLVGLIAQAPLHQWIQFTSFARFIYRLQPLFLQRRQRLFPTPHWWLEQQEGRPLQPLQFNDWMQAEGRYLALLIRGPLHWWGGCDLAIGDHGRLVAFRLTSMAASLFHSARPVAPLLEHSYLHASSLLEVLQTGELLVACSPAAWPLIELIEECATSAGVRAGRLCYQIAPRSLGAALSRGQQPTALLSLLRHIAENDQGQQTYLTRLIDQLERRIAAFGRTRIYTGVTLLAAADGSVLRELAATTSITQQIVQAVQPTLLILKHQSPPAEGRQATATIIEELKRRGQAPLVHEEE